MELTKEKVQSYLKTKGWSAFYNPNYWINDSKGISDYSGKTLCEAYCFEKYGNLNGEIFFDRVMDVEFELNHDKKLGIVGKTFKFKEDLKSKFNAKWDAKNKIWYVDPSYIKSSVFHEYCYSTGRDFNFKWLESEK